MEGETDGVHAVRWFSERKVRANFREFSDWASQTLQVEVDLFSRFTLGSLERGTISSVDPAAGETHVSRPWIPGVLRPFDEEEFRPPGAVPQNGSDRGLLRQRHLILGSMRDPREPRFDLCHAWPGFHRTVSDGT